MTNEDLDRIEDYALKLVTVKDSFPKDNPLSTIILSSLIHNLTLIGEVRELRDRLTTLLDKMNRTTVKSNVISITNDEIKFLLKGQKSE